MSAFALEESHKLVGVGELLSLEGPKDHLSALSEGAHQLVGEFVVEQDQLGWPAGTDQFSHSTRRI